MLLGWGERMARAKDLAQKVHRREHGDGTATAWHTLGGCSALPVSGLTSRHSESMRRTRAPCTAERSVEGYGGHRFLIQSPGTNVAQMVISSGCAGAGSLKVTVPAPILSISSVILSASSAPVCPASR